jgi:hypothetical protein
MSSYDDDRDDMTPPPADELDDLRVEALLRGTTVSDEPRLAAVLAQARSVGAGPAPLPSPALAALLSGGAVAPVSTSADPRWRRRLATVGLVSFGSSAALVGAAAANVLPAAAQTVVARVVNQVTPLTLPGTHPLPHQVPQVVRPAAPSLHVEPAGPTAAPTPTRTPEAPVSIGSPAPQARHTPAQVGRPTGLPSKATGKGDEAGKPSHEPAAKTAEKKKDKSKGRSHAPSRPAPAPSPDKSHAKGKKQK